MLDLDRAYGRHTSVFSGVMEFAADAGWECVIDEFADRSLSTRGTPSCDGAVARATRRLGNAGRRFGIPIVNVWFASPERGLPTVVPDFEEIGRLAATHLMDRGFRRFGAIGHPHDPGRDAVVDAFERTVVDHEAFVRAEVDAVAPESYKEWRRMQSTLDAWLDRVPTPAGLLVVSPALARQVVQRCRSRSLSIPGDVAIVTGGHEEPLCSQPQPGLTSIDFGYHRIGVRAGELLQDLFKGRRPPSTPVVVPPGELVVRESTDFHAVSDPVLREALAFLRENCHRPINCHTLVEGLAVSESTLRRRFRKHLGCSVAAEIRRLRLERAKRELLSSTATLRQVAQRTGFGNVQRLDDAFRKVQDCTPTEFRNGLRRDGPVSWNSSAGRRHRR